MECSEIMERTLAAAQSLLIESIANEYRLYKAWALRRKSLHIVPCADFCRAVCGSVDIKVERVVATVDRGGQ